MTEAYAYLRVSGKGQIEGDGLDRQEAAIRSYARQNEIKVRGAYRELGVSGEVDGMDRPAWVEMIAAALANRVKTILVEKLDRLARLQGIQEYIILDLRKKYNMSVIPVDDPTLSSDDPMRVLFRQIIGAIAQYDKTMIVLKTRAARERIRARGERCEGQKPYGHRQGEALGLARIRELRGKGHTLESIARTLGAEGIPTRHGGPWQLRVISRLCGLKPQPVSPACLTDTVQRVNLLKKLGAG